MTESFRLLSRQGRHLSGFQKPVVCPLAFTTVGEEVVEFITRSRQRHLRSASEALGAVSGIKRITNRSREGVSLVTLEFYWGRNMDYAALSVRAKPGEIRGVVILISS